MSRADEFAYWAEKLANYAANVAVIFRRDYDWVPREGASLANRSLAASMLGVGRLHMWFLTATGEISVSRDVNGDIGVPMSEICDRLKELKTSAKRFRRVAERIDALGDIT